MHTFLLCKKYQVSIFSNIEKENLLTTPKLYMLHHQETTVFPLFTIHRQATTGFSLFTIHFRAATGCSLGFQFSLFRPNTYTLTQYISLFDPVKSPAYSLCSAFAGDFRPKI